MVISGCRFLRSDVPFDAMSDEWIGSVRPSVAQSAVPLVAVVVNTVTQQVVFSVRLFYIFVFCCVFFDDVHFIRLMHCKKKGVIFFHNFFF